MRLHNFATCLSYWNTHPQTKPALSLWSSRIRRETYTTMAEVQAAFPSAKILNGERVRFGIGSHRLIAAFYFPSRSVFIKFIGTHATYDEIDALTVKNF